LKVTLLQTDIHWANPQENIRDAERLIAAEPDSDLYVLPEMWSTGFITSPEGIAPDETANSALQWMQETARRLHCAICGSLAVRFPDETYRNRLYFVDGRADKTYYYDKHHLFAYGHEHEHYTPGQQHTIVNYCGFRLLLLVCYDLRFPCWSRYAADLEYDAAIYVANWPQARQAAWQLLLRARAIENQCYVVGVNRVGDDQFGHYLGLSAAIDPLGRTLVQCLPSRHHAASAILDFEDLQRRREKFRVLDDRD